MDPLIVYIESNGQERKIGTIVGSGAKDAVFSYADEWLSEDHAVPVSLSLPLRKEAFSPKETRNYFEGLLPEGFTRRSVADWLHADAEDYLTILEGLGQECLGAVRICAAGMQAAEPSYQNLSEEDIRKFAAEGAVRSAELVTKAHLSLTGASGKTGLYYQTETGRWFLPLGSAPSTHIVKQSHVRLEEIVTNEQLVMRTAGLLGIDIPESFIVNTGTAADGGVLLASKRFDREIPENAGKIDGLPVPFRLHQEDFAQAMGIPASGKYERRNTSYFRDMFELLRKFSARPLEDMLKLWDIFVFNWLVGNTDGHLKNFSLLRSSDLQSIRLAPAYDLVSTAVYRQSTRDMAVRIGGELSLDSIGRGNFEQAAGEAGISRKIAMARFDMLCSGFAEALHRAAGELEKQGFRAAGQLEQRILESGGCRRIR